MFRSMKTKRCSKCKVEKPRSEFPKNSARRDGFHSQCKMCQREYVRSHYQANRRYYIDKARKRTNTIRKQVDVLKDVPCADCGRRFPPCAMDFDHRDGEEKIIEVSSLSKRGSKKRLMDEIAKCDVVCACCHRVRTFKRLSPNG